MDVKEKKFDFLEFGQKNRCVSERAKQPSIIVIVQLASP